MKEIKFGINETTASLLTTDIKMSEVTQLAMLCLKIIKEYSKTNEDVDYKAITNALVSAVENDG